MQAFLETFTNFNRLKSNTINVNIYYNLSHICISNLLSFKNSDVRVRLLYFFY